MKKKKKKRLYRFHSDILSYVTPAHMCCDVNCCLICLQSDQRETGVHQVYTKYFACERL